MFSDAAGPAKTISILVILSSLLSINLTSSSSIVVTHIFRSTDNLVGARSFNDGSIATEQEMEYSCQQNNHSMAWTAIPKPKSKSRLLSLLLLCFFILCFTTQASALALGTRTNAQPTASVSESDASMDHSHLNVATRRVASVKKTSSLENRESEKDSSSHDMIVRSEKARTVEDKEKRLPREVGERTTGDENGDGDWGQIAGRGAGEKVAGHSFRLRARR